MVAGRSENSTSPRKQRYTRDEQNQTSQGKNLYSIMKQGFINLEQF